MFRQDGLCPGGPKNCDQTRLVACSSCGAEHRPLDIRAPSESPCPECKSQKYVRLPCDSCGKIELDKALRNSEWQSLISRAIDWDFMLNQPGASVTLDDLTAEEFGVLRLLKSERDRYTQEKDKQTRAELAQQSAQAKRERGRRG